MLAGLIPSAQAATSIEIGQYVQVGTYYGEPILWRCVDIDENGPLMLSDKILCLKPFDAETSANSATGSHSRASGRASWGSNYWADSNLRSWLNSSASAGNVEWLCGNPPDNDHVYGGYNDYADEAGFLTNFSQSELNAVKTVTQKSLLSTYDKELATSGTGEHNYNRSISGVVANYDTAYAEQVTDRMFLLDVKQIYAVYNNGSVLGSDYYIGEPTAACVANSEYANSSLSAGNKWYSWLRSPYAGGCYSVRSVSSPGVVYYFYGARDGDNGVRPAFYFNLESAIFKSGSGTASDPYTVEGSGNSASDIADIRIVNGELTATINLADNNAGAAAFFAAYSQGRMTDVQQAALASGSQSVSFSIPANADSVKLFVLSGDSAPLCEAYQAAP